MRSDRRDFLKTLSGAVVGLGAGVRHAPAAFAASAPARKETVKVAWSAGLDMLDPSITGNGPDLTVAGQIYETLLVLDPSTRELRPALATSWKALNDTTWQFKLRAGVKFHNGEPFTAESVKYSVERVLDPKKNSSHRSQLVMISRVEVVDPLTVNVHTKDPAPILPYKMQPIGGSGRVYLMPPGHFKDKPDAFVSENPVGTGPYRLVRWDKGKSVSLERYEEYWDKPPEFKRAEIYFIAENSTRVAALLSGEMDLIQRLPFDDFKRVAGAKGVRVVEDPEGLVLVFFVNPAIKPLDDLRVRLALSHGINLPVIIEALLQGKAQVLPVPMAASVRQFNTSLKPLPYDPAKARALLREAGYPNGLTLKTNVSDGRYVADKAVYDAVNAQLKEIGVSVEPTVVEWGRLIHMMREKKGGPFYMIGWDYGEADASKFDALFHSTAAQSLWKLPRYDELSRQANAEMDPAKRTRLWGEAQKLIYDERAFLATWQTYVLYGMSDRIDWASRFGDNLFLKDIKWKAS